MLKKRYILKILLYLLFLVGCEVQFMHPPLEVSKTINESSLIGIWHLSSDEIKERVYLAVNPANVNKLAVLYVELKSEGRFESTQILVEPLNIKGQSYFVAELPPSLKKNDDNTAKSYVLVRYSKTGTDKITLWSISSQEIQNAINGGLLKGTYNTNGMWHNTTVLSDSAEISKFIAASDVDKLFKKSYEFNKLH
jgi:hypothetical protein